MALRQCPPDRNAGNRTPAWWPSVQRLIARNRSYFPPGLPDSFLGAWVEKESDGRHNLVSKLGEVGYFQLHPEEIRDHFGKDPRAVAAEIRDSRNASVRWGGRLLTVYDKALRRIGVPRGGDLYLGLMKAMHWSPWARIWAQHTRHALGRWPQSYAEFDRTVQRIRAGELRYDPELRRPPNIPSCSPIQLMSRMPAFGGIEPAQGVALLRLWPTGLPVFAWIPTPARPVPMVFMGSELDFPGLAFGKPADGVVTSVWGDHRRGLPVGHEGIDIPLAKGAAVRAAADGEVWHAGRSADPAAGIWVGIQHAAGWATRYMHLAALAVQKGQRIRRGDLIGTAGDTGARSGPHLHFNLLLSRERLPEYTAAYGAPTGGYGRDHGHGVSVPVEPVVPVDGYTKAALQRAIAKGVYPRAKPSKAPWVVGAAVAAVTVYGIIKAARSA